VNTIPLMRANQSIGSMLSHGPRPRICAAVEIPLFAAFAWSSFGYRRPQNRRMCPLK